MKIIEKESKKYYQCEECGHIYEREELANKCEEWCKEHKSCNLEIVKESVNIENKTNLKQLLLGILIGGVFIFVLANLKVPSIPAKFSKNSINENLVSQIVNQVLPSQGFQTRLILGDVVKKMIDCGVIDLEKMKKLYNGKIPEYVQKAIEGNPEPIIINQETANYLLNLFWPLGLSNKTEFNKNIPFSEKDLPYLASTGGWWLGKEENGAVYFNKCEIIKLTKEQEDLVYKVAQNTFRPCCDNSTFAQDCNHGSALLGALELAASQGYNEDELYKLALQLNSFWFPQNYIETAIYFKVFENKDWQNVDPKLIMSRDYSSISGWMQNVHKKVAELNLPQVQQGGSCGL
ncbi:MAG: hypothetical protein QXD89_02495 [Candidatus Aenigmatarchaeota archaeon]